MESCFVEKCKQNNQQKNKWVSVDGSMGAIQSHLNSNPSHNETESQVYVETPLWILLYLIYMERLVIFLCRDQVA